MSVHSGIDHNFLPNLPGFRPHAMPSGYKKHCFNIVNGQVIEKDALLPPIDMSDDASVVSIGNTTASLHKRKARIGQDYVTLTFQAFFEERPIDNNPNSSQIRKCSIYFYTEDGSVKVVEKPQLNSGVSQGTLVRRTVISKPDGTPLSEYDFVIGQPVTIYGRTYQ